MKRLAAYAALIMFIFGIANLLVNKDPINCFNFWLFALVAWGVSVSIPE